jgi:hypothetical protein
VDKGKIRLPAEPGGLFKILVRFSGKPGDDIAAQKGIIFQGSKAFGGLHDVLSRIGPSHRGKDSAAS